MVVLSLREGFVDFTRAAHATFYARTTVLQQQHQGFILPTAFRVRGNTAALFARAISRSVLNGGADAIRLPRKAPECNIDR